MARKRRMRGECVSAARKWVAARTLPSSVRFADSFSLRAKCRLRRLHSDTRLRAQPRGATSLAEGGKGTYRPSTASITRSQSSKDRFVEQGRLTMYLR